VDPVVCTVYHGLPLDLYERRKTRTISLVSRGNFTGKTSRSRHRDRQRAGIPLKIAAKVDEKDRRYYEK
jgi:hypothetical protein